MIDFNEEVYNANATIVIEDLLLDQEKGKLVGIATIANAGTREGAKEIYQTMAFISIQTVNKYKLEKFVVKNGDELKAIRERFENLGCIYSTRKGITIIKDPEFRNISDNGHEFPIRPRLKATISPDEQKSLAKEDAPKATRDTAQQSAAPRVATGFVPQDNEVVNQAKELELKASSIQEQKSSNAKWLLGVGLFGAAGLGLATAFAYRNIETIRRTFSL